MSGKRLQLLAGELLRRVRAASYLSATYVSATYVSVTYVSAIYLGPGGVWHRPVGIWRG